MTNKIQCPRNYTREEINDYMNKRLERDARSFHKEFVEEQIARAKEAIRQKLERGEPVTVPGDPRGRLAKTETE